VLISKVEQKSVHISEVEQKLVFISKGKEKFVAVYSILNQELPPIWLQLTYFKPNHQIIRTLNVASKSTGVATIEA